MRVFFIILALCFSINAKVIETYYRISYGIVGEVGVAKAVLNIKKNGSYTVNIEANSTGFAKSLSGNRNEFFQSVGKVTKDGVLIPKTYTHVVTRLKKRSGFSIDPRKWKKVLNKKVSIIKFYDTKIVERKIKSMDGKIYSDTNTTLNYYVKNDLLSLFFNFKTQSNDFNITQKTPFFAVGADDKDGRLDIAPMSKKLQEEFFESKGGHNFIAIINKPVFASEKGELFVKLDNSGLCTEAVLKDVLFFGDIRGKMVKNNVF